MLNIETLKNNCKNLIMINLNNYDYKPFYLNTKTLYSEFKSNNISIVKFAENLENEIETKNPNLYCNLKITPYFYDDKINNNTILRVEKLKK